MLETPMESGTLSRCSRGRKGGLLLCAVMALAVLGIASTAVATTLVPLSFEEVVAQAEWVVIGRVADIAYEMTADREHLYTFVTLDDVVTLEGSGAQEDTMTLRLSGGHVGDEHCLFVGMPEFELGQKVFLFVHQNGDAICPLVGWTQGYFRVVEEGAREVVKDYSRNPVVGISAEGNLERADGPGGGSGVQASPGVCLDGDAGALVVNTANAQPALSVMDFATQVQTIRAWVGYQPEVTASQPNYWIDIPLDYNEGLLGFAFTEPSVLAPGRSDAFIPRGLLMEPQGPVVDEPSAEPPEEGPSAEPDETEAPADTEK